MKIPNWAIAPLASMKHSNFHEDRGGGRHLVPRQKPWMLHENDAIKVPCEKHWRTYIESDTCSILQNMCTQKESMQRLVKRQKRE